MHKIILIALLSFFLRLAAMSCFGNEYALYNNAVRYDNIANNIINGRGFASMDQPDVVSPPLYVFFLSAVYFIFGHSFAAAQIVNFLLYISGMLLIFHYMQRALGEKPALIAAIIIGIYPVSLTRSLILENETLSMLLTVVLAVLLVKAEKDGRLSSYAIAGSVLGFCILTRPVVIGFPIFYLTVLILFYKERTSRKQLMFRWLVFTLTAYILVLPWSFRNYVVFKQFIPVTGFSAGHNLYLASLNFARGDYKNSAEYRKLIPFYLKYDDWKTARMPDMLAAEKQFFKAGLKHIADYPFLFILSGLTTGVTSSCGIGLVEPVKRIHMRFLWYLRKLKWSITKQHSPRRAIITLLDGLGWIFNTAIFFFGLLGLYALRKIDYFRPVILLLIYALFVHSFFSVARDRYFLPFYPLFIAVAVACFWKLRGGLKNITCLNR